MKRIILSLSILSWSAAPAVAQFQQLIEFHIKPGHELAFESYLQKIKEAAEKNESTQSWSTFVVGMGREGSTYRVGLLFQNWSERDTWTTARAGLAEAFGEEEGAKIFTEGSATIESSFSRIWEALPDGSTNPPATGSTPAAMYRVTIRHVKPEEVDDFRALQRQVAAAYVAAGDAPSITRWILRYGTGTGTTFRRTQPFERWAELDAHNPIEVLNAELGEDAVVLFDRLAEYVTKTESFVSVYRPDLSRTAPSSSN